MTQQYTNSTYIRVTLETCAVHVEYMKIGFASGTKQQRIKKGHNNWKIGCSTGAGETAEWNYSRMLFYSCFYMDYGSGIEENRPFLIMALKGLWHGRNNRKKQIKIVLFESVKTLSPI
jgi:hypothetical protein